MRKVTINQILAATDPWIVEAIQALDGKESTPAARMQLWQAMPRHTNFGLPELIQALYDEDENGVLHLRHALFVDVDPTIKVRAVLADFELVRDTWAAAVEEMAGTTESWQAKEMHGLWVKVCDAISAALA